MIYFYHKVLKYVGYTYLDGSTQKDSTIKTYIDTWYSTNLNNYTKYLEDTPFYNERDSVYSSSATGERFFAPRVRMCGSSTVCNKTNTTIKLGAKNAEDKYTVSSLIGNGYLQYPVGLITSDEVIMAGGKFVEDNISYYLYTGEYYWSLSPAKLSKDYPYVSDLSSKGYFVSDPVYANRYVHPVVSLKPGTVYTTGDGTAGNPYVIATP